MTTQELITSAVICVPTVAEKTLDSLYESSVNQPGFYAFLSAIKKLVVQNKNHDKGKDYFEINDLVTVYPKKRSTVHRYLRMLKDQANLISVTLANSRFQVSDNRLQCYEFLSQRDLPKLQKREEFISGRASQNYLNDTLEYNSLERPVSKHQGAKETVPKQRPTGTTLESLFGTDLEMLASNCTLSPANIISERREGTFYQHGIPQRARATSYYGVFNEEDEDVLRRIQDITLEYLKIKEEKGEIDAYTDKSKVLIPVWVEDIADRQGLSRGPSVLKSINHSIIRAYHTNKTFSHIENFNLDNDIRMESQLRLINKLHIIHANKAQPGQTLREGATVEERIEHDYNKPFKLCVITWHSNFYDRISGLNAYGIANNKLPKLPLMVRRLYEKVRHDFYSHNAKLINDDGYGEGKLIDVIENYWPQVSGRHEAMKLAHEIVKALRLILKPKSDSNVSLYSDLLLKNQEVNGLVNHRNIELDVFGITLGFDVKNLDGYRDSHRVNDTFYFQVYERELVESSGAKYNPSKNPKANKPMIQNVFQEKSHSRHMPDSLKEIERLATDVFISKYFMIYEYENESWLISPYLPAHEIQSICKSISRATYLTELDISTYVTLRLEKMLVLPHVKHSQINELSRELNVEPRYVVEFLTKRIAFITDDYSKTHKMVMNKFTQWYQQRLLAQLN